MKSIPFRTDAAIVWFTGLSGAGKSTLALALQRELRRRGRPTSVLDGDDLRNGLNADLGFSPADRSENARRVAEVARLLAENGVVAVTALISPMGADRLRARQIADQAGIPFVEVYLSTPLDVCEARDPKGLYVLARQGAISRFTGVSAPFEPSETADLIIDTSKTSVGDAVALLLAHLVVHYRCAA
jgi:bifunctional enzyme CysN/CysC